MEESPWATLDGKRLDPQGRQGAEGVRARDQARPAQGETVRGWWRVDLEPVWERYLSPDGEPERAENAESATSPVQSVGVSGSGGFPLNQAVSDSDTFSAESGSPEPSVGVESPANQHFPDTPTLPEPQTAIPPNRDTSVHVIDEPSAPRGVQPDVHDRRRSGAPRRVRAGRTARAAGALPRVPERVAAGGATLAVDVESSGKDPPGFAPRLWAVSDGAAAFVVDHRDERSRALVRELLRRHRHPLALHNGFAYDLAVTVRELDIDVAGISRRARELRLLDTMLLARLVHADAKRIGLKEMSVRYFGDGAAEPDQMRAKAFPQREGGLGVDRRGAPGLLGLRRRRRRAHAASLRTAARGGRLERLLELEHRVAAICLRAGLRGFAVDPDAAAELEARLGAAEERLGRHSPRRASSGLPPTPAGRRSSPRSSARGSSRAASSTVRCSRRSRPPARTSRATSSAADGQQVQSAVRGDVRASARAGRAPARPRAPRPRSRVGWRSAVCRCRRRRRRSSSATTSRAGSPYAACSSPTPVRWSGRSTTGRWSSAWRPGSRATMRCAQWSGQATHPRSARAVQRGTDAAAARRRQDRELRGDVRHAAARTLCAARDLDRAGAVVPRGVVGPLPEAQSSTPRRSRTTTAPPGGRRLPVDARPHARLNHRIQAAGRDIFCAGLLRLEDAGLVDHLALPLHDEYVLAVPESRRTSSSLEPRRSSRTSSEGCRSPLTRRSAGAPGGRRSERLSRGGARDGLRDPDPDPVVAKVSGISSDALRTSAPLTDPAEARRTGRHRWLDRHRALDSPGYHAPTQKWRRRRANAPPPGRHLLGGVDGCTLVPI